MTQIEVEGTEVVQPEVEDDGPKAVRSTTPVLTHLESMEAASEVAGSVSLQLKSMETGPEVVLDDDLPSTVRNSSFTYRVNVKIFDGTRATRSNFLRIQLFFLSADSDPSSLSMRIRIQLKNFVENCRS